MPDRVVKTTLVIDDHGSVKVVKGVGEEAGRTEHKLSGLDRSTKGLGKTFSGLKGMLAGGLGLVGAGGLIFGLSDVISKTKGVAEETEKFHSITGAGTQASLRYSQALKARGLDSEALTRAFGFLDKNIYSAELQEKKFGQTQAKSGQATSKTAVAQEKSSIAVEKARLSLARAEQTGKAYTVMQARLGLKSAEAGTKISAASAKAAPELGRQAKALAALGITTARYVALKPEDKIKTVAKAFENLAAGEKKTRLERELFGKGGNALSIVLEKNALSLENTASKVEKFFGVIHGGQRGQEELLQKQAEAKLAFEGLEFQLGTKLTPVLIKVFSWFSKVSVEVTKGTGTFGELRKTIEGVIAFLKPLWQGFEKVVGPANALLTVLVGFTAMKVSSFAGLKAGLTGAFAPLLGAAAVAASLQKSLAVKKPSKAHSQGVVSDVGGFLTGGLLGNPATSPVNVGRAAVEDLSGAGGHHGALSGVTGSAHAGLEHSKVELHVDGHKLAEALLQNPRARRHIAEATTIYSHGMAARGHG